MPARNAVHHDAVVYAEVVNPPGLSEAVSLEYVEQWEFRLPMRADGIQRGSIRVVRLEREGRVQYREIIRYPLPPPATCTCYKECSVAITEPYYTAWAKTFGDLKEVSARYVFKVADVEIQLSDRVVTVPSVEYTASVYEMADKQGRIWCKIVVNLLPILAYLEELGLESVSFDDSALFSVLPFNPKRILPIQPKQIVSNACGQ